ncbi:coiled-coil domain-containing protein-domain-containing protein [Xylariomycetidae sp. FL2044]|nr:coiled-coil domain-containing protein-domain-containing protein [Xylariomycetidae sp. FL2044]
MTTKTTASNGNGNGESSPYLRPRPRPPRSPAHSAQIRVQNRRREWLERHPEYVDSMEHELADPLLYDALIRRFQSPEERQTEGRKKGYSRVLEVDLLRGEARLSHLAQAQQNRGDNNDLSSEQQQPQFPSSAAAADEDVFIREYAGGPDGAFSPAVDIEGGEAERRQDGSNSSSSRISATAGAAAVYGVERREVGSSSPSASASAAAAAEPQTREEGRRRWQDFLRRRFVIGRDEDFEYAPVDRDDDLDVLERREEEDKWFEDEDPGWRSDLADEEDGDGEGEEEKGERRRRLEGETGIQDF